MIQVSVKNLEEAKKVVELLNKRGVYWHKECKLEGLLSLELVSTFKFNLFNSKNLCIQVRENFEDDKDIIFWDDHIDYNFPTLTFKQFMSKEERLNNKERVFWY